MKTIEEFLLDRLSEVEVAAMQYNSLADYNKIKMVLDHQRLIIDWHMNWPILLETEPVFETAAVNIDEVKYRVTQRMEWLTQKEYRKRFGEEPPTAPLLRQMAASYSGHPDYNTDWEI